MSDEKKKTNKYDHLTDDQASKVEKSIVRLEAVRAVKKMKNPDSDWYLTQELLQEIMAAHIIADPENVPKTTKLVEELQREIEARYEDEPELKDLLLDAVPSTRAVREWLKKPGWTSAVWECIRKEGLFTTKKRAAMIDALFNRGANGRDTQAAKIWLTLSGDYVEKPEGADKAVEVFRDIQKAIYSKKEE